MTRDEEAVMADRYKVLAVILANKYLWVEHRALLSVEDLQQEALLALLLAMRSGVQPHCEVAFAGTVMKRAIWCAGRRAAKEIRSDQADSSCISYTETLDLRLDIATILPTLSGPQREWYERCAVHGETAFESGIERNSATRLKHAVAATFRRAWSNADLCTTTTTATTRTGPKIASKQCSASPPAVEYGNVAHKSTPHFNDMMRARGGMGMGQTPAATPPAPAAPKAVPKPQGAKKPPTMGPAAAPSW